MHYLRVDKDWGENLIIMLHYCKPYGQKIRIFDSSGRLYLPKIIGARAALGVV